MELFDELALEQQGLRLAAHQVKIEVMYSIHQRAEFQVPAHPARGLEVLADAFAEIARFADVNDRPEAVAHQVHPRFVGEGGKFAPDVIGHSHTPQPTSECRALASDRRRRPSAPTRA